MTLELQDGDDPCPFCVWDTNKKAKIAAGILATDCPCRWRNSGDREAHLDAVVHFFAGDLQKRLNALLGMTGERPPHEHQVEGGGTVSCPSKKCTKVGA